MQLETLPLSDARGIVSESVEKTLKEMLLIPKKELEMLKEDGDQILKSYNQPVTNVIVVNDWVISYVIEDCIATKQKTLAISLKNKGMFGVKAPEQDMPYLWDVFGCPVAIFERELTGRGFTIMYVVL
jgi:hypothetical protein